MDPISKLLCDHNLIAEDQVAELEGCEVSTLMARRSRGHMPKHFKAGNRIFYNADDIAERIRTNPVNRRSSKAGAGDLLRAGSAA